MSLDLKIGRLGVFEEFVDVAIAAPNQGSFTERIRLEETRTDLSPYALVWRTRVVGFGISASRKFLSGSQACRAVGIMGR